MTKDAADESGGPTLQEFTCQCCHQRIRVKPSEAGHIAACPFCLKQTLLQVESVPRQRAKLPRWVPPAAALAAITIIVGVALYRFLFFTGIGTLGAIPFLFAFAFYLIGVACWVVGIAFAIYVFNWLRETRVLLREIAANTRAPKVLPKPPEQPSQSAWPSPPPPLIPPEESNYMPKT